MCIGFKLFVLLLHSSVGERRRPDGEGEPVRPALYKRRGANGGRAHDGHQDGRRRHQTVDHQSPLRRLDELRAQDRRPSFEDQRPTLRRWQRDVDDIKETPVDEDDEAVRGDHRVPPTSRRVSRHR